MAYFKRHLGRARDQGIQEKASPGEEGWGWVPLCLGHVSIAGLQLAGIDPQDGMFMAM